jgi:transcriptional regulator with XRE-family HTH domain
MSRPNGPAEALGQFIRTQRQIANLSIRKLASLAKVSNPYLSQIERGLYRPSADVLKNIADALQISAQSLYSKVGLMEPDPDEDVVPDMEEAIRMDPRLSPEQKEALIRVYRNFAGGA